MFPDLSMLQGFEMLVCVCSDYFIFELEKILRVLVLPSTFFFSAIMERGTGKIEEIIMYSCQSCLICFGFLSMFFEQR